MNFTKKLNILEGYLYNKSDDTKNYHFEQFSIELLNKTFSNVYRVSELPNKHHIKLGILDNDNIGFDLIGIDKDGHYHAIKCQFVKDNKIIKPLKFVSEFLATSSIYSKFHSRIYITNATKVNDYIKTAVDNKKLKIIIRENIKKTKSSNILKDSKYIFGGSFDFDKMCKDTIVNINLEELKSINYRTFQKLCIFLGIKGSTITRKIQEHKLIELKNSFI